MIATAAAVGAVATGTFTALIPTADDTAAVAAAAETPLQAKLASNAMALKIDSGPTAEGDLVPVGFTFESDSSPDDDEDGAGSFNSVEDHLALLGKATDLAQQLAEEHAEQERVTAEKAKLAKAIAKGGVDGWIAEALHILELPQSYAPAVKKIIMKESGGNPRAINNWDSNARAGTPSQGLMQTIPSTYRHYVHPDLADRPITDPIANITAGIRYMIDQYGLSTLSAGGRTNSAGQYVGY
ncbi:transglycosylase SLT domain-containing protein [Pseudonocardia sp. TRM90224]|uniref:transglycosylase SLT domain-containing protein n=1 Tax=Pseudonocardia sp. TRM90224 TaxID=2812678 RepID=UPI001E446405|nr:transglycosylase SLT domain-containing protein [Pseudonocardia sp. TRM90224]